MNLLGVLTEWNGVNAAWCVAAVAMGVDNCDIGYF